MGGCVIWLAGPHSSVWGQRISILLALNNNFKVKESEVKMAKLSLATVIATISSVSALRVSPGSPCQTSCVSASSPGNATGNNDIVCADDQYSSTDAGKRYKTCMTCLQGSTYVDKSSSQSDQAWFNCTFPSNPFPL